MTLKEQLAEFEKDQVKIHNWIKLARDIGRDGEICKRYYVDKKLWY